MKVGYIAILIGCLCASCLAAEPKKLVVAVMPAMIPQGMQPELSVSIAETISEQLGATNRLTMVDRISIDKAMKELAVQMSGMVNEDDAKKIGKLVAASHVVTIQVSNPDFTCFITAKVVDVETGVIIAQDSGQDFDMGSEILDLAARVGRNLASDVTGGEIFGDILRLSIDAGFSSFVFSPDLPLEATLHDTHPDDSFMVGSPGTTVLDSTSVNFLDIALSCGIRTPDKKTMFLLEYVFKLPVAVDGRSMHQNDNDTRPPEIGSYIYTQIVNNFYPSHELGLGIRRWIAGDFYAHLMAYGGFWNMGFETGWYRWGSDQTQSSFFGNGPSLSFTGGIAFYPFAQVSLRLDATYRLVWLTYYAYPMISVKMPQGFQLGGSIEYIAF